MRRSRGTLPFLGFAVSTLFFFPGLPAQVEQEWFAQYSGDDRGGEARDVVVDAEGNVYVTGLSTGETTDQDFVTIKYSPAGKMLWAQRYVGSNEEDWSLAIALDGPGNVYVTGNVHQRCLDSAPKGGCGWTTHATIKYDADGNELWVARHAPPDDGFNSVTALAVDEEGNAYITGDSRGDEGTQLDYATFKYDADGNELWVARYDGSGRCDSANAIAVDRHGNVYVTGRSQGTTTNPDVDGDIFPFDSEFDDYATVKYDSDGNELWVARYDGPTSLGDVAHALAVDDEGNVYVVGSSSGSLFSVNYTTIQYDPDGNEIWVARREEIGYQLPVALALDPEGNIVVTGDGDFANDVYGGRILTVKYRPDGEELWARSHSGPCGDCASPSDLVLDRQGNAYVTGTSFGGRDSGDIFGDYQTLKYDPDGNEVWLVRHNPAHNGDQAFAVALDAEDNVYVTGWSTPSEGGGGYGTIKYIQSTSSVPFLRGDTNADGELTIVDGVATLNFIARGASALPCQDAADTDDSGELDITDAVSLFTFLFVGGTTPPAPGVRACGADPTGDTLSCDSFGGCA